LVEMGVARPPGHGGDGGDEADERGEDHQRDGDAVDADEVPDVVGGNPAGVLDELHAAPRGVEGLPQVRGHEQHGRARDQRDDARGLVGGLLRQRARAPQPDYEEDEDRARDGREGHPGEQRAGGGMVHGAPDQRLTYWMMTQAMAPAIAPNRQRWIRP